MESVPKSQGGSYCPRNATLYSGYPVPPSTCQSLHLPSQQSREAAVTITSSGDINRHKEFNKNEGRREGRKDGWTDGRCVPIHGGALQVQAHTAKLHDLSSILQNPHGGRKDWTAARCPLTYMCTHTRMHARTLPPHLLRKPYLVQ